MSCITEILQRKGDKEILKDGLSRIIIEDGGEYKGYEYLVTFNDLSFRCGYVAISSDHPTYHDKEDYPDFDVHGGITFFQHSHIAEKILGHTCTDKWLGFDCMHAGDRYDFETAKKYFADSPEKLKSIISHEKTINKIDPTNKWDEVIRTKEYVIEQCKNLIDQLIEKKQVSHI